MNTLGRSAAHATSLRAAVHKLPGPTDWCCRGQASLMSASLLLQSAAHLNARHQQLRANRKLTRSWSSCCGCCLCLAQGSLEGGRGAAGLGKGFVQARRCLHGGALRSKTVARQAGQCMRRWWCLEQWSEKLCHDELPSNLTATRRGTLPAAVGSNSSVLGRMCVERRSTQTQCLRSPPAPAAPSAPAWPWQPQCWPAREQAGRCIHCGDSSMPGSGCL